MRENLDARKYLRLQYIHHSGHYYKDVLTIERNHYPLQPDCLTRKTRTVMSQFWPCLSNIILVLLEVYASYHAMD